MAVALLLYPAWLLPTSGNYILSAIQDALIPAGLLLASMTLFAKPRTLSNQTPSLTEWIFAGLLVIGIGGSLLSAAPLTRLSGMLSWIEALFIVILIAKLSTMQHARLLLRLFTTLAALAASLYLFAQSNQMTSWPLLIYPNHLALLLILPICAAAADLWSAQGRALLWPVVLLAALLVAVLTTRSRAVLLALALIAMSAGALQTLTMVRAGQWRHLLIKLTTVATIVLIAAVASDALSTGSAAGGELRATINTLAYPEEGSIGGRLRRWENSLPLIRSAPWFGQGFGSWYASFDAYRHSVVPDPAGNASAVSTYVLLLSETGIVGLAVFLLFAGFALFKQQRSALSAPRFALAAWLVALSFHSVSDFTLVLAGFACTAGLAIWRQPAQRTRIASPVTMRVASLFTGASLVLLTVHSQVALAWLESYAIAKVGNNKPISETRALWRITDKASTVLNIPFTMDRLLSSATETHNALRLHPAGPEDSHLTFAQHFMDNQQLTKASYWYKLALSREPSSRSALLGLCDATQKAGDAGAAAKYCQRVLESNPKNHHAHRLLGEQALQKRDFTLARDHFSAAQETLWNRLDINDFGSKSLPDVNRNYAEYRYLNELLNGLPGKPSAESIARSLAQLPIIHTRIAVSGCEVFVTANINARHNLWAIDSCAPDMPMRILANDSLSPFQLQATDNGLFFVSDDRGNGRYHLFHMDLQRGHTKQIELPPGYLHTYRVSPAHGSLAVVMRNQETYSLYTSDPGGTLELLHHSASDIDHLQWHPLQQSVLFLVARKALWVADRSSGVAKELLSSESGRYSNPHYSPSGEAIAVAQRTAKSAANILVHRVADSNARVVFATNDSYALDPVWQNEHTILFREVQQDQYLVRKLDVRDQSVKAVAPESGVAYSMAIDPATGTAWFLASSEYRPVYLAALPSGADTIQDQFRFDWINKDVVRPIQTGVVKGFDARFYRIDPAEGAGVDVIVWLHGGGSSFSPRWHTIAQQFVNQGYSFVALNYASQWSVERGQSNARFSQGVKQLGRLVSTLRDGGAQRVHLLGVSTGTRLLHAYLADDTSPAIDTALEFAPVRDPQWGELVQVPPMLVFTGARDPLFNAEEWQARQADHPAGTGARTLIVLRNEGHDLRGRKALTTRIQLTLAFLEQHKRQSSTP